MELWLLLPMHNQLQDLIFLHEPLVAEEEEEECLHPWVKVDQADRSLPPKSLSILVGLTLKLDSLCIIVNVIESIWTFWFVFSVFEVIAWKGLFR